MSQRPLNVGLVGGGGGAFIVNPNFLGKVLYLAKRLLPGLVNGLFDSDVRRVQRRERG